MADPTTENKVAQVIGNVLKSLIEGGAENAIEASVIADVPWLGLPGFKQLLELALGFVGKYFYTQAANLATKLVIDAQVNLEESATYIAFSNLQMAIASGDKYAIQKASDDLDNAYSSLIHFDGSHSP